MQNAELGGTTTAHRLCSVLESIVRGLERYDRDDRRRYTQELASVLGPSVDRFREAVIEENPERAIDAFADVSEPMYEVNSAATKGEIDFVPVDLLTAYWELSALFRDERG